jgi:LysR family transcriptional regulator, nitrogen assimilation regulatory protein
MEFRSLRYFVQIAELGSVTAAAKRLRVAQPSLTRHLHKLEDDLGVALFVRAHRGVELTAAGRSLLEQGARILGDVDRVSRELRLEGNEPSGKVVLGITPTLCPVLLPQLIARLQRDYPKIELDIQQNGSMKLPDWLMDGRIDAAVMAQIGNHRYISAEPLAQEEMVLLTAPDTRPRRAVEAAELSSGGLIMTEALLAIMRGLLAGRSIELRVDLVLNSLETVRLMAQQGLCRTIMPYSIIRRDYEHGLLDVHRLLDGSLQRQLVLATAAGRRMAPATVAVANIIRALVAEVESQNGFVATEPRGVARSGKDSAGARTGSRRPAKAADTQRGHRR